MPGPKKAAKTSPSKTTEPKMLMPVDGNMTLGHCTFQEALDAVYCTFASVLGGYNAESTKLF